MHTFLRTTIYGLIAVSSLIFGTQARANEAVPGKSLKPNKLKAKRLKAKSAASNMTMLGWLEIKICLAVAKLRRSNPKQGITCNKAIHSTGCR